MPGEEAPGQDPVLGRDPHSPSRAGEIGHGHLVDVGHGLDVDPALGRGHHQVGAAEAQRPEQQHPLVDLPASLAQQVLADDS